VYERVAAKTRPPQATTLFFRGNDDFREKKFLLSFPIGVVQRLGKNSIGCGSPGLFKLWEVAVRPGVGLCAEKGDTQGKGLPGNVAFVRLTKEFTEHSELGIDVGGSYEGKLRRTGGRHNLTTHIAERSLDGRRRTWIISLGGEGWRRHPFVRRGVRRGGFCPRQAAKRSQPQGGGAN